MKPRLPRMLRRVDTLMQRKYWDPETGTPERVKPDAWPRIVREISALGTELHGAWKGYAKADIRDRGGRMRTSGNRTYQSFYSGWGLPYQSWQHHALGRQSISFRTQYGELHSYWNLMRNYRLGWGWRTSVCTNCEARRNELKDRETQVEEGRAAIETATATLRQQMLALRVLVGAMQAEEEQYIADRLAELPRGHVLREPAQELVDALRQARLEAERYDGDSSSRWGQLLRDWVRAHKAGLTLLEKEAEKLDEGEEPAPADEGDETDAGG
ncbi:MAG: hypothetical protein O2894_06590 [Planctomycetota bacterium]|nr:hypothetical protein [Planctomycetota bacterium]